MNKDGKYPTFRHKEQKRFIRLRSLEDEYSENNLWAKIAGKAVCKRTRTAPAPKQFNMLIDIQVKLVEGKSGGYMNVGRRNTIVKKRSEPYAY